MIIKQPKVSGFFRFFEKVDFLGFWLEEASFPVRLNSAILIPRKVLCFVAVVFGSEFSIFIIVFDEGFHGDFFYRKGRLLLFCCSF